MTDVRSLPIDLNCDVGEGCAVEERLMECVTSVNIACGAHAGCRETMDASLALAQSAGVAVGAHPGYEDRDNFGRLELVLAPSEVEDLVARQLHELGELAQARGMSLRHLKPHGGLYHVAMRDPDTAGAIARVVAEYDPGMSLVGMTGSALAHAAEEQGLRYLREAYADRAYLASGELVPRGSGGGVWRDVTRVVDQVLGIVTRGEVIAVDGAQVAIVADTICLHGDTPGVVELACAVRDALEELAAI